MNKVFISGFYGAGNFGDEALLYSVVDSVQSVYEDVGITVESLNPSKTEREHPVETVPRLEQAPLKVVAAVTQADELIFGGGTQINPRDNLRVAVLSTIANLTGTQITWYSLGVQPPNRDFDKQLYKSVGDIADSAIVRDAKSKENLFDAGVENKIKVSADPAFDTSALPRDSVSPEQPYIAVVLRDHPPQPLNELALAKGLDKIVEETGLELLFMAYRDREVDHEVIQSVVSKLEVSASVYDGDHSVAELHDLTAGAELMIGMRLHSIIVAAAHDVPFVTLSYKAKCRRVAEDIGDDKPFECNKIEPEALSKIAIERAKGSRSPLNNIRSLESNTPDLENTPMAPKYSRRESASLTIRTILAIGRSYIKY